MRKVYVVRLSDEERQQLEDIVKKGEMKNGRKPSALKLTRARILLKADQAEGSPAYTDARPFNPCFPVICMDEASKQLVGEVRDPLPMRPGDPLRIDSAVFLGQEVTAWNRSRNAIDSQINWQFTTADARVKLRRLQAQPLSGMSSVALLKPES